MRFFLLMSFLLMSSCATLGENLSGVDEAQIRTVGIEKSFSPGLAKKKLGLPFREGICQHKDKDGSFYVLSYPMKSQSRMKLGLAVNSSKSDPSRPTPLCTVLFFNEDSGYKFVRAQEEANCGQTYCGTHGTYIHMEAVEFDKKYTNVKH